MAQERDSGRTYNRLFVLGGKDCNKEDFQQVFEKYGEVKNVTLVQDRKTGNFKGVTYITFAKASEAALAMEEMAGRMIKDSPKPLKVLLASDRSEGNVRDDNEGERMLRLFIIVKKSLEEDDIKKKFEEYGKVDYVHLLKTKSGDSKGLAFVKYFRAYHCALALEQCDRSHKPVFAVPKDSSQQSSRWEDKDKYSMDYEPRAGPAGHGSWDYDRPSYGGNSGYNPSRYNQDSHMSRPSMALPPPAPSPMSELLQAYSTTGQTSLEVMASPGVTREQLHALLDMTPGLDYCELDRESGVAYAQYKYPQCAAYAKEKLACLEYPPGYRIAVRFPPSSTSFGSGDLHHAAQSLSASLQNFDGGMPGNLGTLVESIKKATDILQKAGLGNETSSGDEERIRCCNVPLPLTKPFAHRDSHCAQRLYIVSQPESFPSKYLTDVMVRFGDLIDAFFMPGKNFGFAKFASMESAEEAIKVLHKQKVCGMRLKVMKAEPPKHEDSRDEGSNKRIRTN